MVQVKQTRAGKTAPTAEMLASAMLSLLPKDGAPVLNRVMRVMLSRQLGDTIDPDLFFKARDLLLSRSEIGRSRGQGGQIFLTPHPEAPAPVVAPHQSGKEWTEAQLMEPLGKYLKGAFTKELDLPKKSVCIVQDTSRLGARGRWARPDFILVAAMRFALVPGTQLDLHSFELKKEYGVDNLAVYEALAQTRFTHFGHLVWHLPQGSPAEAQLPEIEKQCDQHGVGLILMRDPNNPDACEILLDPQRKPTLAGIVDGFLESRLASSERKVLADFVEQGRS